VSKFFMENKRPPDDGFVLFVRAVRGALVARHGTGANIGASADGKGNITWDVETIHPITRAEMGKYGASYRRAIDDKELVECKREAWEAQRSAHMKRKEEVKAAAEKAAKEQEAAAAAQAEPVAADAPSSTTTEKGG
jgi:hypothetical protein